MELAIDKQYSIPSNYRFVIASGLLITNPSIEVRPPDPTAQVADAAPLPKDNSAVVEGAESASALDAIDPQLTKTVSNLNNSFDNINDKLNKSFTQIDLLLRQTNKLVANGNDTIVAGKNIIGDPRLKNNLLETTENFKQLSADTRRTTQSLSRDLTSIVKSSRPKLDTLIESRVTLWWANWATRLTT